MTNGTKDIMCDTPAVERPRYFPRQLITPEDLILEQDYFRNRMRMHNRLLHGWGVVCGALVTPVPAKNGNVGLEPWLVRVCPGFILGPNGDEILIACEQEIPLRQNGVIGTAADPCGMSRNPWCSEIWVERDPSAKHYIAVKYKEMAVRPMRVQPFGCGCDESRCEFSRLRDGYEIRVLTETEYQQVKAASETTSPVWGQLFTGTNTRNPGCWPCPVQPWVVLASITVDDSGRPTLIDNCGPRRLVAALGGFFWQCAAGVAITNVTPSTIERLAQNVTLTISGQGFQEQLRVVFDKGITVIKAPYDFAINPTSSIFKVDVNVGSDAEPGPSRVVVINPDCSNAINESSLEVTEPPAATVVLPPPPKRTKEAPIKEGKEPVDKPRPKRP